MVNISNLPNEMLFEIFLHLDIESVLSSLLVSKRFHSVIMSNWNRLNKKVNVKTLEIRINPVKGTELSLCGDNFGNLRLLVDGALVQCTYDDTAVNTALVRAVIHYFTPKLAYWNYTHHYPSMHIMEFKSICPMASLRDLLLFLLPLIEIQKILPVYFYEIEQSQFDCIIEAFRTTDCTRNRGVPVELFKTFPGYKEFCRVLRSPEMLVSTSLFAYRDLDTSIEIPIRVPYLRRIGDIADLLKEWYIGQRNIFHFTAALEIKFFWYWKPMPISELRGFLSEFHLVSIIRETDIDILIHMRRPKTTKILEISYSITSNANRNKSEFSAKEI